MTLAHAVTAIFWVAVAVLAAGLTARARLWRRGRAANLSWRSLFAIPKRYFVDLHHIVARDPYIARTHIAVAGGAVAALILVAINYGFALYNLNLDRAILIASLIMLLGTVFIWLRRRNPPSRLSRGSWDRLPYTLAAFATGLLIATSGAHHALSQIIAVAAILLLTAGASELAFGIGAGGPMKHAAAGLLHLAFHPRPERFSGVRSTALKPLALDQKEFGVNKPTDFAWNQLLSFDACVQCGKCEAACPAFAAGQPLNPKKLVQDLVAGFAGESAEAYRGSPHPGLAIGTQTATPDPTIVPQLIAPQTLWSCTTCRACVEECPMLIEHVDAIAAMRRHLNLVEGQAPGKAAEILANLRETATQGGYDSRLRTAWALDLNVPIAKQGARTDVLLFVGEGAFDMRYQLTLRAIVKILKAARVDFALFGEAERDTGDLARRLGDEATFQKLARDNIAALATLSFGKILTSDPHVFHSLKNEYPALGGNYDVLHHTTFLAALVRDGRLRLNPTSETRKTTYHDPCYLGRYNGEFDAPRMLLSTLGIKMTEMKRSGLRSRCCGGGGGAPLTDIPGKVRIPEQRMGDAREVLADVVAVACPQCTAMLEGVTGERPQVLDIAELLANAIEVPA